MGDVNAIDLIERIEQDFFHHIRADETDSYHSSFINLKKKS